MKINIPNPCKASWDHMQAGPNGKLCLQCNKQVIDFTTMSDAELIKTLQSQGKNLCGRFRNEQINRTLLLQQAPKPAGQLRKILAGLLLLAGANQTLHAQVGKIMIEPSATTRHDNSNEQQQQDGSLLAQLKGRVIDANTKEPIAFCMLYIKDSHLSAIADKDGFFVLDLPKSLSTDSITLQCNYIGYETHLSSFKISSLPASISIALKPDESAFIMGDIYIIEEPATKKKSKKN